MSALLDSLDCVAHEAPNGATGLRLAREINPELVLLDINLPVVSGREVLHLLKADLETQAIPVAVVTSVNLSESERRDIEQQTCAIIDKRVLSRERLAELLEKQTGTEEGRQGDNLGRQGDGESGREGHEEQGEYGETEKGREVEDQRARQEVAG